MPGKRVKTMSPLAKGMGERGRGGVHAFAGKTVGEFNQRFAGRAPNGEPAVWSFHVVDSQKSLSGFPDHFMLSWLGKGMLRESKGDGGIISDKQSMVMGRAAKAGFNTGFWTPDDVFSGRIARDIAWLCTPDRQPQAARKLGCCCDCHE